MQTWEQWICNNKQKMQHPADFEERFVREILTNIEEICPDNVIPQYHFKDFDGVNRYIDFCIKDDEKGYFLSIELDGRFKFENDYLEKTLQRQNALVAKVGTLVRYANTTWLNQPNRVINEIRTILFNQKSKYMNDTTYRNKIEASLEDYQRQLQEVKEQSYLANNDEELRQLNTVIQSLMSKLEEKREAPQNDQTAEELKNINRMMLGLTQQIDDLRQKTKEEIIIVKPEDINLEKKDNIPLEKVFNSTKKTEIKHIHMALIGVIIIIIVGMAAYILKERKPSESHYSDVENTVNHIEKPERVSNTIPEPIYDKPKHTQPITKEESSQIELKKVPVQSQENYQSNNTQYNESSKILASNAANYIGEYKKVCGQVVQLKEFSKGVYMNLGSTYPKQDLTVVVWSSDMPNFGDLNQYVGNNICVSGEISSYRGTPQIKLSNVDQIN